MHRGTNADDDLEAIVENEHPIAIENENYEEPPPSWIEVISQDQLPPSYEEAIKESPELGQPSNDRHQAEVRQRY